MGCFLILLPWHYESVSTLFMWAAHVSQGTREFFEKSKGLFEKTNTFLFYQIFYVFIYLFVFYIFYFCILFNFLLFLFFLKEILHIGLLSCHIICTP